MKIGNEEFYARGIEPAGCVGAVVLVGVRLYGMSVLHRIATPAQARLYAAELLQAADHAEGRRPAPERGDAP